MRKERKPEFFIVGAPKCGTTFLAGALQQHPGIYMAPKELHYFGTDLAFAHRRITLEKYLSHFTSATTNQVCGEASVWYLYSRRAAREIRQFSPDSKIVIMLRNPVDLVHSLHAQFLATGNESIRDFRSALDAEEDRRSGRRVPPRCRFPDGLLYREVGRLSAQVERYLKVFDQDQVYIILFDELQASPNAVVAGTVKFVGREPKPGLVAEPKNARRQIRSVWLQRFVYRPPSLFRTIAHSVWPDEARKRVGKSLARTVNRINTKKEANRQMPLDLRHQLVREFLPDIEKLEELIGRDLSAWAADGFVSEDFAEQQG